MAGETSTTSDEQVQHARGATYLIVQNLGINVITILAFIVLARLITPTEMGVWAILQLIIAVCQTFITLSINQAVTKFVAENYSKGEKSAASAAFYQGLRTTTLTTLPVVALIYYEAPFLASSLLGSAAYASSFQAVALDVFFVVGTLPVLTNALYGLRMFREVSTLGLVIGGLLRQVLIISLVILLHSFVGLVIGWVLSDAITAAAYFAVAFRVLGTPRFDFPLTKLIRFSIPLTIGNIASFAQTWFDRILLAVFVPLALLGVYNATLVAFGVVAGISYSMNNMLFPAFSSIQGRVENISDMRNAIRMATRYSSFTLVPVAFGLLATAQPSLTLFVGQAYVGGYVPLMILCGAFAFTAFATVLGPVLLALEETILNAAITGVSVAIALVAGYVLLPILGIVGAATARAMATLVGAALTVLVLNQKHVLDFDTGAIVKALLSGAVMAVIVFLAQMIRYSRSLLPVYVTVGAIAYLLMLRLLKAVDSTDISLIRGFLGERFAVISRILSWILL